MNRKPIVIIITAMLMTLLSGCSSNENAETPLVVTTTQPAIVTTAEKPQVITDEINVFTTEEEPYTSEETEPYGTMNSGYVADSEAEVYEILETSGMVDEIKPLSREAVIHDIALNEGSKVLYRFAMYNQSPASLIETAYITELNLEGELFYVVFGDSLSSSSEEVEFYCSEGSTWNYYGYVSISDDGNYIVMPLIAGSEVDGYWAVRPVLSLIGADRSKIEAQYLQ